MDKKNFEKDINVPSKRRIMDDYNAKDCEQCSPDSVCCYCKNIACYQLEETIDCLLKIQYQLADNNKKLRQTLTEIKEIAEKGHKEKGNLMRTWWFKDILQKISECEGNND